MLRLRRSESHVALLVRMATLVESRRIMVLARAITLVESFRTIAFGRSAVSISSIPILTLLSLSINPSRVVVAPRAENTILSGLHDVRWRDLALCHHL